MSLNEQSKVVVSKEQVSCDLAGEAAILNLKNGVYYGLDPVGARNWNLIQEPKTFGEVRDILLAEYDVDAARLSPAERALVVRAALVVARVRLRLWFSSVGRLSWTAPNPQVRLYFYRRFSPARLAWAVRAVSRMVPGATCLTQALALHYLLARAGHTAVVRIGVAQDAARGFQAHAWV